MNKQPKQPWYKKWWAITLMAIGALIVISIIINPNATKKGFDDGYNNAAPKKAEPTKKVTPAKEVKPIVETKPAEQSKVDSQPLNLEVLDERKGETLYTGKFRYEVVGITSETDKAALMKIANKLKSQYQSKYDEYGDIQIYLFDAKDKEEVANFLKVPTEESNKIEDNALGRLGLIRKKDKYSILFLRDENGNIYETIEDF